MLDYQKSLDKGMTMYYHIMAASVIARPCGKAVDSQCLKCGYFLKERRAWTGEPRKG
jgi:hypothetical protein